MPERLEHRLECEQVRLMIIDDQNRSCGRVTAFYSWSWLNHRGSRR